MCCPDPDFCVVVNQPKPLGFSLGFKLAVGGVTISFDRKVLTQDVSPSVKIKLRETFKTNAGHRTVALQTTLTGADAAVGSLLYPVAFVGLGSTALDALHARGLDVRNAGGQRGVRTYRVPRL